MSDVSLTIPGMMVACSIMDSLLLSTLECLYSECCLSIIYHNINQTYLERYTEIPWFKAHLLNDSKLSRYPSNSSVKMLLKEMMIEQWHSNISFEFYYKTCVPTHCTYSDRARTYSPVQILTTLISAIRGLTAVFRLTIPLFINMVFTLLKPKIRRQRQGNCQ